MSCLLINQALDIKVASNIYIENSVCGDQDYKCLFWKTDQEFSDKQISCFTPPIPYDKRSVPLTSPFILYLRTPIIDFTCAKATDCTVYYKDNYTPELISITPKYFAFGSFVQTRIIPKGLRQYNLASINNPVELSLLEAKFGKNNCIFSQDFNNEQPTVKDLINKNARVPKGYWDSIFNCFVGDGVPETIPEKGLLINFNAGMPNIKSTLVSESLDGKKVVSKIFPKIETVSTNTISQFGDTEIVIQGKGFIQSTKGSKLKVYLDDKENECKVTKLSPTEVTCVTSPVTTALKAKIDGNKAFVGSPGLHYKKYNTNKIVERVINFIKF